MIARARRLPVVSASWCALIVLFLAAAPLRGAQPSGVEVMKRVNGRDAGRQVRMTLRMTLTDERRGTTRERVVELLRLRTGDGYRSRFRVVEPENLAGTALLIVDEDRASKLWLYFPATNARTELLTRGLSALGSDFSCENLRLVFPLADYTFTNLGTETVDGHPCWRIELRPRTEALQRMLGFARAIGWVRKDASMIVRADFFDGHGQLSKVFRADPPLRIDGIWTLRRYAMISERTRHRTDVVVTGVDYAAPVDPGLVDPERLGRE